MRITIIQEKPKGLGFTVRGGVMIRAIIIVAKGATELCRMDVESSCIVHECALIIHKEDVGHLNRNSDVVEGRGRLLLLLLL